MATHAANHHLRRALVLALTSAALLGVPATAQGAAAKLDSKGKLTYTALQGEANDLKASYDSAGVVRLSESGHLGELPILIAGSGGCSGLAAQITCNGATSLEFKTGDGDDRVDARNGTADKISCGPGTDVVTADPNDAVANDCETVERGTLTEAPPAPAVDPGTGSPSGGGDPQVDGGAGANLVELNPNVNIEPPAIPRQTASVSRSGVASVQVVCPPGAGACQGTVQLVLMRGAPGGRARVVAAGAKVKGVKIGSARFSAQAGEKPIVRIRLNRRGRRRILRTRHTHCRVIVTTRSADGRVVTTSRDITLRPRRTAGRVKKKR